MRIRRDFTFTAFSVVRRHQSERAIGAAWFPALGFSLTIWEWTWSFGFGYNDGVTYYGPWLSYMKPSDHGDGYWMAALSDRLTWESPL